jgi:hypothetical protein
MPVKSTKDAKYWKKQIELSLAVRARYEPWWESNLKNYAPSADKSPESYGADINTNRDFTLVERKKADLFYQRPDVTLQPSPLMELPMPGPVDPMTGQPTPISQAPAIQAHQQIVNEKLGPDGIDATRLVHQTLFDVLSTSGIGFTKMGYESHTVEVEQEIQVGEEPNEMSVLGLGPGTPILKKIKVPVPVSEKCYWEYFSPKRVIIPHDFHSTEWDKAPYIGMQFTLPLTDANREKYHLTPEFKGKKADGKQRFDHGTASESSDDVFTGVEIYYRSILYRSDIHHPDHLTKLVIVDGVDTPVIEEDSPDQTLDGRGRLTPDSLIGFPIHPLNVRTLTDSAYPPSDSTMIRPLVNELNVYREQQVQFRDAATLKWVYNTGTVPPDVVQKMVRSPIGGMIGAPPELFPLEHNIVELPQGSMPRESFLGQQAIDDDIARTVSIDGPGAGVQSQQNSTATEAQIVQSNANARLDFERGVVLQWYVKGVTKYSTLIQRYLPVEQAAQIVGPQLAQAWDQWRKAVPSSLAFTAMPDSALRVDQAVDRKSATDFYSFIANDPYCQNARQGVLTSLFRKHHLDPKDIAAPPPAKPEPPKLSFSFKGEDLVGPQSVIVLGIAEQLGIKIDPSWVTLAQAALQQNMLMAAEAEAQDEQAEGDKRHGGKLPQQESLSKHASDATGGMQNTGAPAAMGGAGGFLQ